MKAGRSQYKRIARSFRLRLTLKEVDRCLGSYNMKLIIIDHLSYIKIP